MSNRSGRRKARFFEFTRRSSWPGLLYGSTDRRWVRKQIHHATRREEKRDVILALQEIENDLVSDSEELYDLFEGEDDFWKDDFSDYDYDRDGYLTTVQPSEDYNYNMCEISNEYGLSCSDAQPFSYIQGWCRSCLAKEVQELRVTIDGMSRNSN